MKKQLAAAKVAAAQFEEEEADFDLSDVDSMEARMELEEEDAATAAAATGRGAKGKRSAVKVKGPTEFNSNVLVVVEFRSDVLLVLKGFLGDSELRAKLEKEHPFVAFNALADLSEKKARSVHGSCSKKGLQATNQVIDMDGNRRLSLWLF